QAVATKRVALTGHNPISGRLRTISCRPNRNRAQKIKALLPQKVHFSTRLNVHDHALTRAQLDAAVYGLVLAIPGGGYEQSPSQFTGGKPYGCRLPIEIERNQDALAAGLARENQEPHWQARSHSHPATAPSAGVATRSSHDGVDTSTPCRGAERRRCS